MSTKRLSMFINLKTKVLRLKNVSKQKLSGMFKWWKKSLSWWVDRWSRDQSWWSCYVMHWEIQNLYIFWYSSWDSQWVLISALFPILDFLIFLNILIIIKPMKIIVTLKSSTPVKFKPRVSSMESTNGIAFLRWLYSTT